jgi:putative transposase
LIARYDVDLRRNEKADPRRQSLQRLRRLRDHRRNVDVPRIKHRRPAHYHPVRKPAALRRPLELGQYTSIRYTERLDELGAAPSVGSRGDVYDNAMAEAWVASFKSELVDGRRFPSFEHAEHETLHWIGFYNEERLHEELGDLPPREYEELNIKTDNSPTLAARQKSL